MTPWNYLLRSAPKVAASAGTVALGGIVALVDKPGFVSCEGNVKLKKRISSVGRLSLVSETKENPLNSTILIGLVGKPFTKTDFVKLWQQREMESRHPRFHQQLKEDSSDKYTPTGLLAPTQQPLESHILEKPFPRVYNVDLQERLESCLRVPLNVHKLLWQVEILQGGQLGQSGAIPKDRAAELTMQRTNPQAPEPKESLLLFRGHNALADGISLATSLMDLCDEAEELKQEVRREQDERKRKLKVLSWWERLKRILHRLYFFSIGSLQAFWNFWKLYLNSNQNPFQQMENFEDTTTHGARNVSWVKLAPAEELKEVAKSLSKAKDEVTVTDVILACVTSAVARQMQEHQMTYEMDPGRSKNITIPKRVNAIIPVHLEGGRLKDDETVGHKLSAYCASVPSNITQTAAQRVQEVHESLQKVKATPVLFWTRLGSQVLSYLPGNWAATILQKAQPNASFMLTQWQGPSKRIHFSAREVEMAQGFAPLPPGLPLGVVVSTYAGEVTISITAEPWAVPDATRFLDWVLEEYKLLYTESPVALQSI